MPFQPEQSLLRVEVPALHTIDTSSVENLFGMWSLFSKTSHAMQDGKRLENLSWRLWNRETFCCEPNTRTRLSKSSSSSIPSSRRTFSRSSAAPAPTSMPVPALSSSPESASSDDDDDDDDCSTTDDDLLDAARPELRRPESTDSRSGGCAKHITPTDLEKIVISITETKQLEPIDMTMPAPISRPRQASVATPASNMLSNLQLHSPVSRRHGPANIASQAPAPPPASLLESSTSTVATNVSRASNSSSHAAVSDESSTTEMSTHSIVRGFVPGGAPSSYRSQTNLAPQPTPNIRRSPQYQQVIGKKKGATFTIGSSSGEEESSLESHMYKSSLSEHLKHPTSITSDSRKQTSFKDEVTVSRAAEHSPVFESDDEDEEVSESAIEDDDDSSDWEDSDDQSGPSSMTEKELFQRVDSRPNLTSRRSLLTTLMHEPDRAKALSNAASRSTPAIRRSRTSTPNGPSVATSPEPASQLQAAVQEHPRAKAIMMNPPNSHPQQLALSPRTTRRNMLSTELTESLRKNLLWERQHRSTGNLAALKRRHTANDMRNLRQHPEPGPVLSRQNGAGQFTNDYFHAGLGEYHAKGW